MRPRTFLIAAVAASGLLAEAPVFERALPKAHLNEAAGQLRSNVRWSWYRHGFIGDDLQIGAPGERWVIDRIRVWTAAGNRDGDPNALGEFFEDVRLYFGEQSVSPVLSGRFAPGAAATDNPRIRISAGDVSAYEEFGRFYRVWRVDFDELGLEVGGARAYRFAAWGLGREIPDQPGRSHAWFNLASNAASSEARQDGADNRLLMFDGAGRYEGAFDSDGKAWNKSSDLNVEVFAHRVAGVDFDAESAVLYGGASFDTRHVDMGSLRRGGQTPARWDLRDVNGDGYPDLSLHFSGALRGCLSGRRLDGVAFEGCTGPTSTRQ